MQGFEITIDGAAHPGHFATLAEAEAVANTFRQAQPGKTVATRAKSESVNNDGLGTFENVDPSKVLVQNDGVIHEQHGVVEGHGAAVPAAVATSPATPAAVAGQTPSTAPAAVQGSPSVNPPRR